MDGSASRPAVARPAAAIAAVGSIMAGLVHAAAAFNHEGDALLAWMFGLCAAAQVLWGVIVTSTVRPPRTLLLVGLVVNGGALLVWALTRTVGIPVVDSLAAVEAVGRQDLGAALFAGASVLGSLVVLVRPQRRPILRLGWVGGLAAVALVAALPAMGAEHTHEHSDDEHSGHEHLETASSHEHDDEGHEGHEAGDDHGHADGGDHADGEGGSHGHDPGTETHDDGHAHGDLASTGDHGHGSDDPGHGHSPGAHPHPDDPGHPHPGDPDDPHPHPGDPDDPHPHPGDPDDPHPHPDPDPEGPITSIDDPRLTDEQWDIAVALILSTTAGLQGFVTEADVLAAGYTSIGDGGQPGGYTHYINWSFIADEHELDPTHVESIVMKMNADGTTRVVAAMYILTTGKSMTDAPELAGELTTWHDHDNLCFADGQFVGLAVDGACSVGVLGDMPPMLHVWVEANPCGPFAAIDEDGMDCGAVHEH